MQLFVDLDMWIRVYSAELCDSSSHFLPVTLSIFSPSSLSLTPLFYLYMLLPSTIYLCFDVTYETHY